MLEIKGAVTTAICYANIIEEEAVEQIRRMCESLGYNVKRLVRVRIMNVRLGGLKPGAVRKLTEQELMGLYEQIEERQNAGTGRDAE